MEEVRSVRAIHLEETYHELVADHTALLVLYNAAHDSDGSYDRNALDSLFWARLCLLEQHISDLANISGF